MSAQLDALNAAVSDLSTKVDVLIAKPAPAAEDLAPVTAAVEAIAAKVVAAS